MINRQQGIVVALGAALGVACLVTGVFFFMALSTSNEAKEKRDSAYNQLKALYESKVFPNATNIQRLKDDKIVLETWMTDVSNVLVRAGLKVDDLTPVRFKQELQKIVRELAQQKSASFKNFVAPDFKFGFDRYLGDSDSLPQTGDVAQLAQQLKLINLIVRELYDAKIMSLTDVEREEFEEDLSDKRTGTPTGRQRLVAPAHRPGRQSGTGAKPTDSDAMDPVLNTLLTRQKFTFGFQAKPVALIGVLNRLAAMDAFVVVSGIEFTKAEDSILLAEQRKKAAEKASEEGKPTVVSKAATPFDRIVTDPEREPPMNVKLSVDVYLFKGV